MSPGRLPEPDAAVLRAVALLLPIGLTLAVARLRRPSRPQLAGALLATIWNLPALLVLHRLAARFGWWSFEADGGLLDGLPVDLWLGWALLWGAVPQLAFPRPPAASRAGRSGGPTGGSALRCSCWRSLPWSR